MIDTPLLTFKRGVEGAGGSTIIPALATGLPVASNGGKTYTFTLRSEPALLRRHGDQGL